MSPDTVSPGGPGSQGPAIPSEILDRQRHDREHRDATPVTELMRPPSRWRRRLAVVGVAIPLLLALYYAVSLFQVWSAGTDDQARSVDAIVVMGAAQYDGEPSPQLAARLDHVAELWPQGISQRVVVTGGQQPGDRFTEASASAAYLVERGVPESAIVLEDRGVDSFDSLRRVADLLIDPTASGRTSVLIVTDPYHTLRSKLIAEEVGFQAFGSPTPTSVVTGRRSLERHLLEAGGVAVGRITGFDWLSEATG